MGSPARAAVVLALWCLFASADLLAHAVVVESTPRDGAELNAAPREVELVFNVRVEHALVRASLRSGDAAPVPLPVRHTAGSSPRLIVPLPALGAGRYEIRYQVLAADGHTTQGVLRFSIAP